MARSGSGSCGQKRKEPGARGIQTRMHIHSCRFYPEVHFNQFFEIKFTVHLLTFYFKQTVRGMMYLFLIIKCKDELPCLAGPPTEVHKEASR